jgi:hypothetical protein
VLDDLARWHLVVHTQLDRTGVDPASCGKAGFGRGTRLRRAPEGPDVPVSSKVVGTVLLEDTFGVDVVNSDL